jgi:Flp pilus assembly protein TadD
MSDVAAVASAAALLDAGRPEDALRALQGPLTRSPDDHDTLVLAASSLLRLDRFPEAEATVRHALAHGQSAGALQVLALAAGRRGDRATLWEAMTEAVHLAPTDWNVHASVVVAAVATQRYRDAVLAGQTAVRLAPDAPGAHVALGDALLASNKVQQALEAYGTALGLDPTSTAARTGIARAQVTARRPGEGAARLVDLLAEDPSSIAQRKQLFLAVDHLSTLTMLPLGSAVLGTMAALSWAPGHGVLSSATGSLVASGVNALAVALVVVAQVRFFRSTAHRLRPIVRSVRRYGIAIMARWEALMLVTVLCALVAAFPGPAQVFLTVPALVFLLLSFAYQSRAHAELSGTLHRRERQRQRR